MDIAILLAARERSIGFDRPEGFDRAAGGRLTHSNSVEPMPPFVNIGVQIIKPQIVAGEGSFSIVPIWKRLSAEHRLYGAVMDGFALHVSDPAMRDAAEARLA
jgi:MurNAc alpha-1-phosphate uridylyltransferase